jgi:hypothetical protein
MTEAEWNVCTDPDQMLEFLKDRSSGRKLRLFAVACCHRIWHLLDHQLSRRAVEVAERFADGQATHSERAAAEFAAHEAPSRYGDAPALAAYVVAAEDARYATAASRFASGAAADAAGSDLASRREDAAQVGLLRDVFGPLPFRAVTIAPSLLTWNDGAVVKLAQAIYEGRAFERMPELAEALEQAGCREPEVLAHCRQQGQAHVRGCWVVDLVLGRQ